jgi:hypothetical protein
MSASKTAPSAATVLRQKLVPALNAVPACRWPVLENCVESMMGLEEGAVQAAELWRDTMTRSWTVEPTRPWVKGKRVCPSPQTMCPLKPPPPGPPRQPTPFTHSSR